MRNKMLLVFMVLVIMSVFVISLLSIGLFKTYHRSNVEDRLYSKGITLKTMLEGNQEDVSLEKISVLLEDVSHKTNTRITLIDKSGVVLVDTRFESSLMENHAQRPEVQSTLKGEIGKSSRYSDTISMEMLYMSFPLELNDFYVLRLAYPYSELQDVFMRFALNVLIALLVGVMVSFVLGFRYFSSVVAPIKYIAQISEEISCGNLSQRAVGSYDSEIGVLCHNFNQMADKLQSSLVLLKDENIKLEAILNTSPNGVIALSKGMEILLINPKAKDYFAINKGFDIGKHFSEVVRQKEIDLLVKSSLKENKCYSSEVELENDGVARVLRVNVDPIYIDNKGGMYGVLLLATDITELRKLERVRSEFVANVTHELKTPLTSIKGFVETLKNGALANPKLAERFLDIIDIEATRLSSLIGDVLVLSELENKARPGKNLVNVRHVIDETITMLSFQAKEKNIRLKTQVNFDGEIGLKIDRDKLKQLFLNLIDNSIKYGSPNGNTIIKVFNQDGVLRISVEDDGEGIKKEDLDRIFERFYKADRARTSGKGTGLGLAIVKHLVLLMEGKVTVESEYGKGTKILIEAPVFTS